MFSSEIDKNACKTYEHNFGVQPSGDITAIEPSSIPDHDILVGGFPCQAFSFAGKRQGFSDPRGQLIFRVLDILKTKQPQAFILENVKGLLHHDGGNTFSAIVGELEATGYQVAWQLINAKHFAPQARQRVYIVGMKDCKFVFPNVPEKVFTIGDILEPAENVGKEWTISERTWSELQRHEAAKRPYHTILESDKPAKTFLTADRRKQLLPVAYPPRRLKTDQPAWTFCTQEKPAQILCEGTPTPRLLTIRERARCFGFPDSFEFPVCRSAAKKQLGNSVVVPVIKWIAEALVQQLRACK